MDPATAALIIKAGGELANIVINLLRAGGAEAEAGEILAILKRSDDVALRIIARANEELGEP